MMGILPQIGRMQYFSVARLERRRFRSSKSRQAGKNDPPLSRVPAAHFGSIYSGAAGRNSGPR